MKLKFFTRYGKLGASSRYRFYLWAEELRSCGHDVTVENFFDDGYLKSLYSNKSIGVMSYIKAYWRRIKDLARAFLQSNNCWVIEYELLPFVPYFLERLVLRRPYILNFDDNVWEKYAKIPFLRNKFDCLVRRADGVVVANTFLEEKVAPLNKNIIKIPTVLNPQNYVTCQGKYKKFTVVWIGTPVTYKYLEAWSGIAQKLAKKFNFELLVVAKKSLQKRALTGVNMRFEDWSVAREGEFLARSHIGIMPLTDDAFSRGKSAFKLIQYLTAALPVIASPVGENLHVVQDGKNGFLADDYAAWERAFASLYNDKEAYKKMAAVAKSSASAYFIKTYSEKCEAFLGKVSGCD